MFILFVLLGVALLALALQLPAVNLVWAMQATITETLPNNIDSAPDATRKVVHSAFNEGSTLTATTTPPVSRTANFVKALTAGAATIDLTAVSGTNGVTVDLSTTKVQVVRIKNLGANTLTVKAGASNGHTGIFTATNGTVIQPGGIAMIYSNNQGDTVDATHKTWDLTGTGTQTAEWTIVTG